MLLCATYCLPQANKLSIYSSCEQSLLSSVMEKIKVNIWLDGTQADSFKGMEMT